jgi:CheY-like chemotaxis protein
LFPGIPGTVARIRVPWGDFVTNPPEAAHVASFASLAARFESNWNFHKEAATRFAFGGVSRGDKVLLIGSRWQFAEILRAVEDRMKDLMPGRDRSSWRNRDIAVLDANELQSELLVNDNPDAGRFASFVESSCQPDKGSQKIRVWNDLGARLYDAGHREASRAVERLWHQTRRHLPYTFLCSYVWPADTPITALTALKETLQSHTHMVHANQDGAAVVRLGPPWRSRELRPIARQRPHFGQSSRVAEEFSIGTQFVDGRPGILVVDDDEGIRENIADLLGTEGYRVFVASDANEAMERLAAEDVDLLLTDFQMPGRNGVELIEAARTAKKDLPVILMTGHLRISEQIDEERRKGIPLLRKPFGADEVLRLVAASLDKSDPGSTMGRVGLKFPSGESLDHR